MSTASTDTYTIRPADSARFVVAVVPSGSVLVVGRLLPAPRRH